MFWVFWDSIYSPQRIWRASPAGSGSLRYLQLLPICIPRSSHMCCLQGPDRRHGGREAVSLRVVRGLLESHFCPKIIQVSGYSSLDLYNLIPTFVGTLMVWLVVVLAIRSSFWMASLHWKCFLSTSLFFLDSEISSISPSGPELQFQVIPFGLVSALWC